MIFVWFLFLFAIFTDTPADAQWQKAINIYRSDRCRIYIVLDFAIFKAQFNDILSLVSFAVFLYFGLLSSVFIIYRARCRAHFYI